jgi:hypothetical protein
MKKLFVIFCVSLFTTLAFSQGKYIVPTPSDLQKYQDAAWQWNNAYIILVSHAKAMGKSAEETGSFVGDMVKATWNKEIGFDGFVNNILYIWVTFNAGGTTEILEQSGSKIVFRVKDFHPEAALPLYNVTYKEYLQFFESFLSKLAEHMSSTYIQIATEEGLVVTVAKK